jgi:ribosomal protein S13
MEQQIIKPHGKQEYEGKIIRILSQDIEGKMKIYPGLTKIKGISWSISNAICKKLKIDKNKKIGDLTNEDIKEISEFIKSPEFPEKIINRKRDLETGKNKHLIGNDLELQNEFDIKRLKKIKNYKGYRHIAGLPVRGQKTKGHFRKNKSKGVGIKKKSKTIKNEKKA